MNMTSLNNEIHKPASPWLHSHKRFTNSDPNEPITMSKFFRLIKRTLTDPRRNLKPQSTIPVERLTRDNINSLPNGKTSVMRLGHSTVLIKIANQLWLLDPVFSERASPFSLFGPKRFHPAPISPEDLPDLEGVIISHNHYDHMDAGSVRALKDKVKKFVVPLGNATELTKWGIPSTRITELGWWQSTSIKDLELVATPARHFSGRGINDRDKALWSSWVLRSDESRVFFSGDSGYFEGFKAIGKQYGPFDLTLVENGAYDSDWPDMHMTPRESAQAHLDLKGRKMLPIHNGTFNLAFHAWTDPFEQLVDIANREWIDLLTPKMGQVITLGDDASVDAARDLFWWR